MLMLINLFLADVFKNLYICKLAFCNECKIKRGAVYIKYICLCVSYLFPTKC